MVHTKFTEFLESLNETSMDLDTFSTYSDSAMKNAFGTDSRTFAGSRGSYGNPNFLVRLRGFGPVRQDLQQGNAGGGDDKHTINHFDIVEVKDSETGEKFQGKLQNIEYGDKDRIIKVSILQDDETLKDFVNPYSVSKIK